MAKCATRPLKPDLLAHGRVDVGKLAAVFDAIID